MFPNVESNVKLIMIGKAGVGKTGSLASLVATGQYELCILDTDKGVRALKSLLTDPRYPYAEVCRKNGVDINKTVDVYTIDQKMRVINGEIRPANATGWSRAANAIEKWKHDDIDYGNVGDWAANRILVVDTLGTLAQMAYYFSQAANGRLGESESGNSYRRDVGGAQSHIRRLLELLFCDAVKCNVIIISHITWVDDSGGINISPEQRQERGLPVDPDGYPTAIGRALSPIIGKYFNDVFTVRASGSGQSVRRQIVTVPNEGVVCKNSTFLRPEYDIRTGLAEIFSEMRKVPLPAGFLEAFRKPQGR